MSNTTPTELMTNWLESRLDSAAADWLGQQLAKVKERSGDRALNLAFSMVPRKLGKTDLNLSADELNVAAAAREGWDPSDWTVDQVARLVLVLSSGDNEEKAFLKRLEFLFSSADVGELTALYRGLPLYPYPLSLKSRAAEGVRTNMKPVYEAVAHRNPFPSEQLDDIAWNQMVLKALFIGSPLWPIQGLEKRANPALAEMLTDYAHERWAASREVSPELWRCVGPCATEENANDFERLLASDNDLEKKAGVLAVAAAQLSIKDELLSQNSAVAEEVNSGNLNWDTIGKETNA